jgi:hypothetical protein
LTRPTPGVWVALALLLWSVLAIADGTDAAPPPSVAVVLGLALVLASARNRRMRTTGRLLLAFLALVFAIAVLGEPLTALTVTGLGLVLATGLLAVLELVRG